MVEINEVRRRDTMIGRLAVPACIYCGSTNLRWEDEKIKCKYCGELI